MMRKRVPVFASSRRRELAFLPAARLCHCHSAKGLFTLCNDIHDKRDVKVGNWHKEEIWSYVISIMSDLMSRVIFHNLVYV